MYMSPGAHEDKCLSHTLQILCSEISDPIYTMHSSLNNYILKYNFGDQHLRSNRVSLEITVK